MDCGELQLRHENWQPQLLCLTVHFCIISGLKFYISQGHRLNRRLVQPLKGVTTGSVSYTHLDVYKRQVVTEGDKIVLTVSLGKALTKVTIGYYVGMDIDKAKEQIKDLNLKKVVYEEEYSSTVKKGEVMEQNFDNGAEVVAETTTLIITVSKGPEK